MTGGPERRTTDAGLAAFAGDDQGPFIGRTRELQRLEQLWRRARDGRATYSLIDGEPGIGKTRLTREFAARVVRGGGRLLWGNCMGLQGEGLTYAPFRQALRETDDDPGLRATIRESAGDLATLLAGADDTAENEIRYHRIALFESMLRLFRELASTRPVLLVVEDVHWADPTTLDLLTFLSQNLGDAAVLGILTCRSHTVPVSRALQQFLASQASGAIAERVHLTTFDERETTQQVVELAVDELRPAQVKEIVRRSGGNPFFVEALLASRQSGEGQMPESLRHLLSSRAAELPDDLRDVLEVAAVAGQVVDYDVLRAVIDLPHDALDPLIRQAVDAGLLTDEAGSGRYVFRHALLQEALYDDLLMDRRRELHRRFADVLVTRQRDELAVPGAIARHWDRAGRPERALPAYLTAARAAKATFGFVDAERFLRRAYELWDDVNTAASLASMSWRHLANKTIDAALSIEEAETAVTIARHALAHARDQDDRRAVAFQRAQLVQSLWYSGDETEALAESLAAFDALRDDTPSREQAIVFALRAGLLAIVGRYTPAGALAERALDVAVEVGAPRAYRIALATLGSVTARRGDLEAGLALLEDAETLAKLRNDADEVMRVVLHRGRVLQAYSQWNRARSTYVDGLAAAPKYGMHQRYSWRLHVLAARMLYYLGRWDEAEAELGRAREQVSGWTAALPSLLVASGRFDEAEAFYASERSNWRSDGTGRLQVPEGPVELATWQCRFDDGRTIYARALELVGGSEEVLPEARLCHAAVRLEADAIDAGWSSRADATARAARLVDRLRSLHAERPPRPDGYGWELAALTADGEAELTRVTGEPDERAWSIAVVHWDALGMPYPAAYARWRQADAVEPDDVARAAQLRDVALESAQRIGAGPLCDAIQGVARRGEGADGSARGRAELTRREQEVVDLLVKGHTNRDIATHLHIAEGTASVHVSNILRKLGVGSRTQAISLLLRRRGDDV